MKSGSFKNVTKTHTHTHKHIYIYVYACVWGRVCVCDFEKIDAMLL